MGTLESDFDSAQGFPYKSSSHMAYKILYVNSFLDIFHQYDFILLCKYFNIV